MRPAALVAIACAAVGCGVLQSFAPIETADDLASALQRNGVAYTSTEPLDFSRMRYAKIEEGIRLRGENLIVEILRIEDRQTFEVFEGGGALLTMLGSTEELKALDPPELIVRRPFFVVVRQEPDPGQVGAIVRDLIPDHAG